MRARQSNPHQHQMAYEMSLPLTWAYEATVIYGASQKAFTVYADRPTVEQARAELESEGYKVISIRPVQLTYHGGVVQ